MEKERQQEIKESPEEIKAKICQKALWLKNDFYANANDWLEPDDYSVKRGEAEGAVHNRRKNKFLKGWFSMLNGFILSPDLGIAGLPTDDVDRIGIEEKITGLWPLIQADIKRVNDAELQVVKETLCGSDDFRQMVKDFELSTDPNDPFSDKNYLYLCVSTGNFDSALRRLWPIEKVQEKFEFSEEKFKKWLEEHFSGWVKKYFELKKKYRAISPETVKAGDQILNIVIERLNKNKTQV